MVIYERTYLAMAEKAKLVLILASTASLFYAVVLALGDIHKVKVLAVGSIQQLIRAIFLAGPLGAWFLAMSFAVLVLWPVYRSRLDDSPQALEDQWKEVVTRRDEYLRWTWELFLIGFAWLGMVVVAILVF
jgi:hypothetical protein